MKLYAISDLHLAHPLNREALEQLPPFSSDWLILAGDVGDTAAQLEFALRILTDRFARVLWVPGNHDLWTLPSDEPALRGVAKYRQLVAVCRRYGVLTPEDPYIRWPGDGPAYLLAPLFTLYDYTFRPNNIPAADALAWAEETGVVCTDEFLLHPDPYPSREAWCTARCQYSARRLETAASQGPLILINHYPLHQGLIRLRRIPRFSLWCGTRQTEDWATRFSAAVVVYGHLHIRGTQMWESVRYEEVSLGYPRDWDQSLGMQAYLRQILPTSRTL